MNEQQAQQMINLLTEIRDLLKGQTAVSNQEQSFTANKLTATVDKGNVYWKVTGGVFQKFGVNVWPEVLDEIGLSDLDPLKQYDLAGWTAVYITNENGSPKKITQMHKPDPRGELAPEKQAERDPRHKSLFRKGDEVLVAGKNDEKPGTVIGLNGGGLVIVDVEGKELKLKPDRLTLVDMA